MMHPGTSAFGIWSGGHFMHFGNDIGAENLEKLVQHAYESGICTFLTADVYGQGEADELLGRALAPYDRDSYCLAGAVGHDFYHGVRQAEKGFPRFTNPELRDESEYASYLEMATDKSLERLGVDRFDLLLLHNPDKTGYQSDLVWTTMNKLKADGKTGLVGVAPGPANGFTVDVIDCFERHGASIDWAMIILNPLEPWPGGLVLNAAEKHEIKVIARVVDYGGFFHGDLKPGIRLPRKDHRSFRPAGWIETAFDKLPPLQAIADNHRQTLLQLACKWDLAQPAVESVLPTLLQEVGPDVKSINDQVIELANVDKQEDLTHEESEKIRTIGDNRNCMSLKGASTQYLGRPVGDQWPMTPELLEVGRRWNIEPDRDLYFPTDIRDIREKGAARNGIPQTSIQRLYLQLHVFGGCKDTKGLVKSVQASGLESFVYADVNDPFGIGLLMIAEDPECFVTQARDFLANSPFTELTQKPDLTMIGRSYAAGREPNLEDWLLRKPRRNVLNPNLPWAVWYPLRRKSEFNILPPTDQGKILMEHAMIGRAYGSAGYAQDIRLACYGLDRNDNEFVIGLVSADLYPLSKIVQEMRKTQQTAKHMDSLGPFFVGKSIWQCPMKK